EPRWSLAEPPPGLFPAGAQDLLRLLAVLAIAAAVAAACSVLNRRPAPFCDSDDPYDSCEPCPENGRCVDGELRCVEGFKKRGRVCVEDGLLTHTANKISELLQHRICDEHAHALCGQGGKILDAARLSDDGIKVVKERVLQSAHGFLETTSTYDKVQAFKCPELAAELHRPLSCQARQWVSSNIVFVMTFCVLSAGLLKILWSIYQRRALSKRAEQIYEQVCEILEDNAVSAKAGNSECEPWVVTSWLRDHLLSTRERRNTLLWKKVEELLLEDSRIDQYPKVIKGEAKVVLEWQASGSLSGKIKKLQGAAGKTRSGSVGAIKLAEEICGSSISSSRDKELCSSTSKEATNPFM
uniref:Man1/Src1-like C-terminal domain-containing protein n=1 Tax=Aegilops tauschii subsp. strangulata TaxID=200361 RepID=A0A453JBT4_AEGTS